MNVVLFIPMEHYDLFLEKIKINSREHILLRNGIINRAEKIVEVPCEIESAKQLLEFARILHPEIAPSIEQSILHPREL